MKPHLTFKNGFWSCGIKDGWKWPHEKIKGAYKLWKNGQYGPLSDSTGLRPIKKESRL